MEALLTDEIIDEIHAVRREHATRFDFDMQRIIADLRNSERKNTAQGWPLVQARESSSPDTAVQRIRFFHR
jgi:hypothetical protein